MHRFALTLGEKHSAEMLRVSGHFSAVLGSQVLCTSVRRSSNGAICSEPSQNLDGQRNHAVAL
jgi:hypothetical protein